MLHKQLQYTAALNLGADLTATIGAFFLAWYLRFTQPVIDVTRAVPDFGPYLRMLPFILLIWPTVYYFQGLYQIRRGQDRVEELIRIVVATILALIILTSVLSFDRLTQVGSTDPFSYSRGFFALFVLSNIFVVALLRFGTRAILRSVRQRRHDVRRILIVGTGDSGKGIAAKLVRHRELGYEVVGFLDDDADKQARESTSDLSVIGALDNIEDVIEQHRIDQVIIALPFEAHRKILDLLKRIGNELIEIRLVPNVLHYASLRADIEDVDGTPVINLSHVPLEGWSSLAKRLMDIGISLGTMTLLLPLLAVVMALIKLQDRGPLFYRQERMGLDGRSFVILKFRSMRTNTGSLTGPAPEVEDNLRRTRIGAFFHRWSLDELPQLWNVFRGDMSIVGPRPEAPTLAYELRNEIPNYMLRHRVKAGLTGWAQIHGWRGRTPIRERIQHEIYYIQNWSLRLDFQIIWQSLRRGLTKNAYSLPPLVG